MPYTSGDNHLSAPINNDITNPYTRCTGNYHRSLKYAARKTLIIFEILTGAEIPNDYTVRP
jgi:hypothetical protein